MKRIILLFSLLVISYNCEAQKNTINSSESTINGVTFLGIYVSLVIQHFGQPNSIEDYYYEMEGVMSKKYNYNGIIFTIINGTVDSFEITATNYSFTEHKIKIGDNIDTLQKIFPLSYKNRVNNGITLPLSNADKFIVISYSNNLIVKIALYSY